MKSASLFFNFETAVLREFFQAEAEKKWNSLIARRLSNYHRELVIGEITCALQRSVWEQQLPADRLVAKLYSHALTRVDFYTIALELVQEVEVATHRASDDDAATGQVPTHSY
jgi:hypothetical protein